MFLELKLHFMGFLILNIEYGFSVLGSTLSGALMVR